MRKQKKEEPFLPKQKSIVAIPKFKQASQNENVIPILNQLYFGDCLEVLKVLTHQEPFIDLIYIDPPFNSKRNYNVLFESIDMKDANAQKQAFADTWSNVFYIVELQNLADLNKEVYDFLYVLDKNKSISDGAVAYLTIMALRIYYMHKLLKETGSFYLHCDPTMSHYLKLICDMIFGCSNYRNEIVWKRTNAHNDSGTYGNTHDIIHFYTKTNKFIWNKQFQPYDEEYIESYYRNKDADGRRWMSGDLSAKGLSGGGYEYDWKGVRGLWRAPIDTMKKLDKEGKIYYTKNGIPRRKRYLDEAPGMPVDDIVYDIEPLRSWNREKLGYPTQKPEALLERIIKASSNEGDVVADFFCGCGTTIAAAQKLNRKWLGADISHLAVKLILYRLEKTYGKNISSTIKLNGFPKDVASAKMLASETKDGRFGFQEWAIEVLLHGVVNPKKVGDGGYDGYLTYQTDKGKEFALIETKSGNVNVKNMREFIQVINKQNASAGIFVCFDDTVSKEMRREAKAVGTISIAGMKTQLDKIQILTIEDILNRGMMPRLPNIVSTFKQAEKFDRKENQLKINF